LDLWPLYLLHEGSVTVNLALDRRARATVERIDAGFEFASVDLGRRESFSSVREACESKEAGLAAQAVRAVGAEGGLRITVSSEVPFGSGLGGSSALLVALVAALARLEGRVLSAAELVVLCRDAETRVLLAPAGTQDYEAALRGGLNTIRYGPGAPNVVTRSAPVEEFRRHLLLFDSGRSHHSGLNNWEVYKARIDQDRSVIEHLDGIRDAAQSMAAAAESLDFEGMGRVLAEEWNHRKRLSSAVSTPQLDEAEGRARRCGAWGAKACGAGGGGILAVLLPPEKREEVISALSGVPGARLFQADCDNEGVRFEV
jgi:D-glycero-alpha-D-manno-heptose-7-phosphate kinase